MLPGLVVLWGLTTCLTGVVQNYRGLLAARFFLGLLEGGVFPGLVLYLSTFYRRAELQIRISLFFSAASLSGAFSGLLAAAIVKMEGVGGLRGWRWIFIVRTILEIIAPVSNLAARAAGRTLYRPLRRCPLPAYAWNTSVVALPQLRPKSACHSSSRTRHSSRRTS